MNLTHLDESPHFTRRRLLGGAVAVLAAGLSGACSSDRGEPTTGRASSAGPFQFTDDRGKKISLPAAPTRIVAQVSSAAVLWDFGVHPIGVVGPQSPAGSYQAGSIDLRTVQSVGKNWGEFNVEKYASLRPELLVTSKYGPLLWDVPPGSERSIEQFAPLAVVELTGKSVPSAIESYARLAGALGADLDSPAVKQARTEFERASDGVRAAVRAKPGLKVLAMSSSKDNVFFARPADHADLKYFHELGLDIVEPAGTQQFFELVSWEQIDKYPADLILYDARELNVLWPLAQAQTMPTWKNLPAVKAGQVGAWRADTPSSYQQYTRTLQALAATLNNSRPEVVT